MVFPNTFSVTRRLALRRNDLQFRGLAEISVLPGHVSSVFSRRVTGSSASFGFHALEQFIWPIILWPFFGKLQGTSGPS